MRYKVFYGADPTDYAVCYGATEKEAQHQFSEYNPVRQSHVSKSSQMLQNLIQTCST